MFSPLFHGSNPAILHVITAPLGIEAALSMLVSGSLFGLFVVPIAMVWLGLRLMETSGLWQGATSFFLMWVGLPFAVCYTVHILILDKLHLEVNNASPLMPRNAMERAADRFFSSSLDYFPSTCIPWAEDASLPPSK